MHILLGGIGLLMAAVFSGGALTVICRYGSLPRSATSSPRSSFLSSMAGRSWVPFISLRWRWGGPSRDLDRATGWRVAETEMHRRHGRARATSVPEHAANQGHLRLLTGTHIWR